MDCVKYKPVTIFNAYNYVTCSLGGLYPDNFYIEWNPFNKELDDIMTLDACMRDEGRYYNHFWVDKLKSAIGWVPGNRIYIRSCYMYRGRFHIKIIKEPNDSYVYEQIDENGYLRLRKFNERVGYYSELEVVDCLYHTKLNKMA
jgi:hypothetical protein